MLDVTAGLQVFPEPLDRVQLRAVGRQPHQDDVLRQCDALGDMRWRLVEEHDVETLRIMVAKLAQQDGEAGGLAARPLPPEGRACGGFDRRLPPVILLEGLDAWHGLHPVAREAAVEGQLETQTTVVWAADPHRLLGRLPP